MKKPSLIHRTSSLALACVLAPACSGGGGGSGGGNPELIPDEAASEFLVTPAFGTPADGTTPVEIEVRLINMRGRPISGAQVVLDVSGYANKVAPLPMTDASGSTRATLASLVGERKTLTAQTMSGGRLTALGPRTVDFLLIPRNTFFVRVSGSDASTGRSPREAWRTLTHALDNAVSGAVIHVGAGVYSASATVQIDSSAGTPLVISGDRTGVMTGDAGDVVIEAGGLPFALLLLEARHVVVQGLTLRGARLGLGIQDSEDVLVLACRLQENDFGLVAVTADGLIVQDCSIIANRTEGLRLRGVRRSRLENNLIYDNLADGMVLFSPGEGTAIRFNTFFRNGRHHLRETGGTGSIVENIFAEGGEDALALGSGGGYRIRDNLVWGNAHQTPPPTPGGFIEADPLFVDPTGLDGILGGLGAEDDDFRLMPGSAANDIGTQVARDVVLGSQQSLATRTTRSDNLFEWSGDDHPATNLGFHARLAEGRFLSLAKGGGRISHAVPGEVRAHQCAWGRESPASVSAGTGPILEAEIVYLEQRVSPLDSPEELLAVQVNSGTQGRVLVRHWDGRRWTDPALAPFLDGIPPGELADRRFDIEYEMLSGRALLVMADDDGRPSYRVLERGGWSAEQPVADTTPGAGRVRWVELVSRPQSNELALVTLDDQHVLLASLWDGLGWSAPRRLATDTVSLAGWRPFDLAFESLSGDLLVMWGFNVFSEEARWATLERSSGQWLSGQHPSTEANCAHVVLASDPGSDRIAVVMGEGDFDNDVAVSAWNGSEWNHTAELTLAGPKASRLLELTWIGKTGIACAVFRRQEHTGSFNVACLLPGGWRIQPDVVLPGLGRAAKVCLRSLSDQDQLLGAVLDESGRLFGLRYDGQSFSLLNDGNPLATGFDPAAPGRPFDVAVRPPGDHG